MTPEQPRKESEPAGDLRESMGDLNGIIKSIDSATLDFKLKKIKIRLRQLQANEDPSAESLINVFEEYFGGTSKEGKFE